MPLSGIFFAMLHMAALCVHADVGTVVGTSFSVGNKGGEQGSNRGGLGVSS